ncbi:MAG: glycosyl hydrolase [Bacteroidota bacterium]
MTHPKSNSDTQPSDGHSQPEPKHLTHLREMKRAMAHTVIPFLGLSEPTISAAGTRRLHEANPTATQQHQAHTRPPADILLEADFVQAQRQAQPEQMQAELPRMVQYDLYHLVEAMPESRAAAPNDAMHSFFHRKEAHDTLLDHCQYFLDQQSFLMLMWHTYHPGWEDQDFYRITNQTGISEPIGFDDTMNNPFNMMHLPDALSRGEQQKIIKQTIKDFDAKVPKARQAPFFRQKLDRIADFAKALADRKASAIFRPYHEHSPGNWFWWCLDNLSDDPAEAADIYRELFQKTRAYLERQGVDNLLYCYSPDLPFQRPFENKADFLAHYHRGMPDAEQVEVLGMDAYLWKLFMPDDQEAFANASTIKDQAAQRSEYYRILARPWGRALQMCTWLREEYPDKLVGLTETGWNYKKWGDFNGEPIEEFWQQLGTQTVLALPEKERPHFLCLWRNDIGDRYCPWDNGSNSFAQEAVAIARDWETQVVDLPPSSSTIV